ncbi:hypothetical protein [Microlunatus speluncae]|uniref:hypothetical protein n=1 Tax=Microlunatus speluncae TaxID=2594267 RepID=UPI00126623F3|nr:hypothetical protein [Microlunatus speluncae]
METNELNTLLRQADEIDRPVPVDTLVEGGIRRGQHQLRTRRLTVAGALGTTLAAVGVVAAFSLGGGPGVPMSPAAVPTTKPTPTQPAPKPADDGTLPSVAELSKVIKSNLPDGLSMREVVPTQEKGNTDIVFELGNKKDGYGWAGGGVFRNSWYDDVPCDPAGGCTETEIDGGVLQISRDTEKVGDGTWYWFRGSDGTGVWFGQRNAFEGNGPVTREELPLSDKEAIELLTDPKWQQIADLLPEKQPAGDGEVSEKDRKQKEQADGPDPSGKPKR